MHDALNSNLYLVKEHVGMFKAANNFDILHPEDGTIQLECREPELGFFTKLLRFTDYKRMTPFNIVLKTPDGQAVLRIKRGISIFISKVHVFDDRDQLVGGFKQKFFSLGGAFKVLDPGDNELCVLQGKWTGWNFSFKQGDTEYAHVTKKWAGMGKELFTSADNYILQISDDVPEDAPLRNLIMAAVLCIDMVLKE